MKKLVCLFVVIFLAFFGCRKKQTTAPISSLMSPNQLQEMAKKYFQPLPSKAVESKKDSHEKIALGKRLYFEKGLSINNTISCNSCHPIEAGKAGMDGEPTSPGAFGKRGGRNSPTVLNAVFHIAQFWDGRAKDLVEQAKGPILNPVEMAMKNEAEVIKKLQTLANYPSQFKKAFPQSQSSLSYQNIGEAIATFERTLITHDRLDDFLKGDLKALKKEEQKGLDLFVKKGCVTCHSGPLLGGQMYQKMGLVNPYKNIKDLGRFDVTKKEDDKYFFKVPSLRNVGLTQPYFHDGSVKTLEGAVEKMAWLQLGKKLTKEEITEIVAFLKSLTGKKLIKEKK